jgi:hypothetical protein
LDPLFNLDNLTYTTDAGVSRRARSFWRRAGPDPLNPLNPLNDNPSSDQRTGAGFRKLLMRHCQAGLIGISNLSGQKLTSPISRGRGNTSPLPPWLTGPAGDMIFNREDQLTIMAEDELSADGKKARFARWDEIGLDRIKADLLSGGHQIIGGPHSVRNLAWE